MRMLRSYWMVNSNIGFFSVWKHCYDLCLQSVTAAVAADANNAAADVAAADDDDDAEITDDTASCH